MRIPFTKMHGAGNDFVVIDAREQPLELSADQARHLADRQRGIGCDQILVLHAATDTDADFAYRIYNAKGGEVQQCGNGARALALLGRELLGGGETLRMQSPAGLVRARFDAASRENEVSVDMGPANFDPAALPMEAPEQRKTYSTRLGERIIHFAAVSMGNPHAVLTVNSVTSAPVEAVGSALQQHALFPASVNVGFMHIKDPRTIALRVYERGVGETLACGTGACAAVVVGHARGDLEASVRVELPGGQLVVNCEQPDQAVWLTGPAHVAFKGHIEL